jgi:putative DNA primase/helicase
LAWAVKGCLKWQAEGLKIPESIRAATQDYRDEQDPLKDFFENECEFGANCYIAVTAFRQWYDDWAKKTGLKYTLAPQQFNARLRDKNCEQKTKDTTTDTGKIEPTRCWIGVTLLNCPKRFND